MSGKRTSRALVLGLLALTAMLPAAAADGGAEEAGRIIGQAVAAGALLASDGFAASGRYDVDDAADSSFRVLHAGYHHAFARPGRWEPFVGGSVGRVTVEQDLDLGGPLRDDSEFEVRSLRVDGGTRVGLGEGGWFARLGGRVDYSFAESRLDYRSGASRSLAPVIDGVFFNWTAEAVTLAGAATLGWERRPEGATAVIVDGTVIGLRTDPVSVDDPVQDVTVTSSYERVRVGLEVPLGVSLFSMPLRLDPRVRHTRLADALAEPLDGDDFTDMTLTLLALRPEGRRWPVRGIGLQVTYTTADAFDGWSVGLSFGG